MSIINSVLGPLDTRSLGFTLMHEHLSASGAGIPQDYPELLGDGLTARLVGALAEAKESGIDTIVDATTLDLGRDVKMLAQVSRSTGVNIVACTGWWLESPHFVADASANQLAALFIREIEKGISGTEIRPGILKGASDVQGVTDFQENVLRAVARAHLRTGVPIMLHSYPSRAVSGRQLAILKDEGVRLSRVKVDHSNDTADIDYLKWLLDQGCYLGLDRYPGRNDVKSAQRTRIMKFLLDAGYADRLLPSHDYLVARIVADTPTAIQSATEIRDENPYGVLYIRKVVFPELEEMGVSRSVIESLCVDGPRKYFEGA